MITDSDVIDAVVSCPATSSRIAEETRFLAVDLAVRQLLRNQARQQPGAGLGLRPGDQSVQVDGEIAPRGDSTLRGRRLHQPPAGVLEEFVVLIRHAEQPADHHGRHRQREPADQVGGRPGGEQVVEEAVHDLLDIGAHGLDPFQGELADQHPPLGAVFRRIHADESRFTRLKDPEARRNGGEVRVRAVGRQAWIGEQGAGGFVFGDHPGLRAVEERHLVQRILLVAQLRVLLGQAIRAGAVAREGGRVVGSGCHNCVVHRSPRDRKILLVLYF
ncbi:hypothetical protein [Nocardia brasiliensis]